MEQKKEKVNEVSLKDIFLSLNVFLKELIRFWWIILIGAALGAAYFGYQSYTTKPVYTANLTFMLNEESGQSMGTAVSSLLGRFGGSAAKYNLEKILALSRARVIIEQVLFAKTNLNGKKDYIANHFIDIYEINEKNKKLNKPEVKFSHGDVDKFNENESYQLINIYNLLVGSKGILSASTNEKSGIMSLQLQSTNEDLSIVTVDTLFAKLSQYYIDKSVEKERLTYNLLRRRVEQLYGQMNNQMTSAVTIEDKSLGVWEQKTRLPQIKYERDTRISAVLYGEALKNLELADFSLKTKTPFIQILDSPLAPLEVKASSKKRSIIIGILLGSLVMAIIIILRKIIYTSLRSS